MWFIFAILSAVFAALTSILAKVGINNVNSNLATAIRTMVVVLMSWGMVFITNAQSGITEIDRKSWLFLILSGLATGASWLFYYKALQSGDVTKVVPIDSCFCVCFPARKIRYKIACRMYPDRSRNTCNGSVNHVVYAAKNFTCGG